MAIKTSTSRVAKLREEANRKGWKRRDYYASPDEHEKLKGLLVEIREGKNNKTALMSPEVIKHIEN